MALTQISTAGVKDDAVTSGKIPANAVGSSELADNAVDTAAIQDDAVTAGKLADDIAINTTGTITAASFSGPATQVSLAAQSSDTDCFPVFSLTATGNQALFTKSNRLAFNSSSGALSATSFVGDGSNLTGITQTTINNNADNRLITGSGTANTLEGEQYLTWNGSTLGLQKSGSGDVAVNIEVGNGISQSRLLFSDSTAVDGTVTYDHNDRKLHLGAGTSSPTDGDITIDSSGNVGIGTTSPSYPLDVQAASGDANMRLRSAGTGTGDDTVFRMQVAGTTQDNFIYFGDSADSNAGYINYNHDNDYLRIFTNAGERMRILSSGVVCIGRTTETVDTNNFGTSIGSVLSHSRGITGASPCVAFYGAQGYAQVMGDGDLENTHGRYGSLSDQTLKENIVDANSQWNDIKNIKIRNFNFKESTGYATHKQIGVIAQELETVCPNLVDENDQGIKAVASSVLYMKAVKALQEAQARIETLETKVAALEAG